MVTEQETDRDSAFDIVIVGAGLTGIVFAARYLQAHPTANLALLEQEYCVGGVWNKRRVFDGFWTQWAHGIAEFADLKMKRPPEEDCWHDFFRAKWTTAYLEQYVDTICVGGRSLRERVKFGISVRSVRKVEGRCTGNIVVAEKLIMANGLCTIPRMPTLHGRETFKGAIIHSLDYGQYQSDILTNTNIQHITVLGGGKSSADMVYEATRASKTVSWVINPTVDGKSAGPGFLAPGDLKPPGYRNPSFMAQTRWWGSLQPCIFSGDSWWTRFLHGTSLGVKMITWIFAQADATIRKRARFKERGDARGFEGLDYETSLFWQNGTGGVQHHIDFYDVVAAKVTIHRASIKQLLGTEIYIDDDAGTHFPCDTILCGTGWHHDFSMFSLQLQQQLGLPHPKTSELSDTKAKWDKLLADADAKILTHFPILTSPPPHPHIYSSLTPYCLHRGMAPLTDRTILFLNHTNFGNKLFGAEAQAMWATAYLSGHISLPSLEEREREVATWNAWNKRRYLSNGELGNNASFNVVSYVDLLMQDMGVGAHKGKGFWGDWFAPVMPEDLGKAWEEYLKNRVKV